MTRPGPFFYSDIPDYGSAPGDWNDPRDDPYYGSEHDRSRPRDDSGYSYGQLAYTRIRIKQSKLIVAKEKKYSLSWYFI